MKRRAVITIVVIWFASQTAFGQSDGSFLSSVYSLLFAEQITYVEISGFVFDSNFLPLEGVVLAFSGLGTATTDTWGYYKKDIPERWTGTVTPWKGNYLFDPASTNYTDVVTDLTLENYDAQFSLPVISGKVTLVGFGIGVNDVLVTLAGDISNQNTTTDEQGNYSFQVSAGWNGTVTPSKAGFNFTPTSRAYSDLPGSIADQGFVAESNLPLISGVVTFGGIGLSGVNLSFTSLGSVSTNSAGFYYMPVPNGWSGIVTPSHVDLTFKPEFRDYYGVFSDAIEQGYVANTMEMSFEYIAPGTFTMGSPSEELGHKDDETQHQVTLTQGFYMQTTEVTQGQWRAVMGTNPSYFGSCGFNCPVEQVSWEDAQAFVSRLNAKGEGTYRLPTEAEWEYAARAGSTTAFANGDITGTACGLDPNLNAIGWYCYNSGFVTHPVAQKQPNAWGLYDMHGNVVEWVQDWYDGDYGLDPVQPVTDPSGPPSGSERVYRGGSCSYVARGCRSAERRSYSPDGSSQGTGFRLVREP